MLKTTLSSCVLAAALGLGATPALAWGPEGHTVIARAATTKLTAQASSDLDWIVRVGVPALNARIAAQYGQKCQIDPSDPWGPVPDYQTDQDRHTNLANWADCYRYLNSKTAGWHFNDIPLGLNPTGWLDAGHQAWCPPAKSCASVALANNLRQLARPGLEPADAAMALAFVVHFVGDMHQPLHEEDNGDTGGNDVHIDTSGAGVREVKLHALWDTPLVEVALGADLDQATAALEAQMASDPPVSFSSVDEVVGTPDGQVIGAADGWAEDAHQLALPAYSKLGIAVGAGPLNNVRVTSDYVQEESHQVVAGQLVRAAERLRAVLNVALTWTPTS